MLLSISFGGVAHDRSLRNLWNGAEMFGWCLVGVLNSSSEWASV